MKNIRAAFFILALYALILQANAGPVDEAAFYAYPGERAEAFKIDYKGLEYYLVVVNSSPAALLAKRGLNYEPMEDYDAIFFTLSEGAAIVENATGLDFENATDEIMRATERSDYALHRKAYYVRRNKLNAFKLAWANLSRDYDNPRRLKLPVMDNHLAKLESTVESIRQAKTSEAVAKYTMHFDDFYNQADSLYRAYLALIPEYRRSAVSLINASNAINAAVKRSLVTQEEAQQARRELGGLEADLVDVETQLINGKPFLTDSPYQLSTIITNATRIATINSRKPPDQTPYYVGVALVFLLICVGVAYYFRVPLKDFLSGQRKEVKQEFSEKMNDLMKKLAELERQNEQ